MYVQYSAQCNDGISLLCAYTLVTKGEQRVGNKKRVGQTKLQKGKRPVEFREGPPSLLRPMSEYVAHDRGVLL